MIKTTNMLISELKDFNAPANKLARNVNRGDITPIIRGLYETDSQTPGYLLASSIYGPSYLSFDYALACYNLIPEFVYNFTSATFEKKKNKTYKTSFGVFMYRDVPKEAYPLGIRIVKEGAYYYLIAEPEKALCDKLYIMSPVYSQKDLKDLLFNDLRIDLVEFEKLDKAKLMFYAKHYQTTNHKLLIKMLGRIK